MPLKSTALANLGTANPAPAQTAAASRVLRATHRPSDRLPHPSWRAATGYSASAAGAHSARISASAKEFWYRLGL